MNDPEEYSEGDDIAKQMRIERLRMLKEGNDNQGADDHDMIADVIDYEDVKGTLSEWVQRAEVVRWIRKNFSHFLHTFKDEHGVSVYEERIREMCSNNKQSLEITFQHLS